MESMTKNEPARDFPYASIRGDCYALLAVLLENQPSEGVLKVLHDLQWEEAIPGAVDHALRALIQASHDYPLSALEDEYDRLFVGLGSGEVIPYASWYRKKTIQSSPLASLRSDLMLLGIVRQAGTHEPEDHAGALCECMALIAQKDDPRPLATQERFFRANIAPWMADFFEDLQAARSAGFYRTVGLLGSRFMQSEMEYFKNGGRA